MTSVTDRFDGRILGAGTSEGLRFVVGDWRVSPLGTFTDVMVATSSGRRLLLAPSQEVADYVTATYRFDDVQVVPVDLHETKGAKPTSRWELTAGPLRARLDLGSRTVTGRALRAVPPPIARSRAFAVLADPIARRVHRGVRTYGTAGQGRREYYGALDQHAVTALTASWEGADLGGLADVDPPPDFGFSSTPRRPSLTRVVTTIVRAA